MPTDSVPIDDDLLEQIFRLKEEHRDLDEAIHHMHDNPFADQLRLRRLKLRKLQIKDEITRLESELIPDLDA